MNFGNQGGGGQGGGFNFNFGFGGGGFGGNFGGNFGGGGFGGNFGGGGFGGGQGRANQAPTREVEKEPTFVEYQFKMTPDTHAALGEGLRTSSEAVVNNLKELETVIFADLKGADSVAGVIDKIKKAFGEIGADPREAKAELAHMFAVAGTLEKTTFRDLVDVIQNLVADNEKDLSDLPWYVAKRCLVDFPFQSRGLLIEMLEREMFDPVIIYDHLKTLRYTLEYLILLMFFAPELARVNKKMIRIKVNQWIQGHGWKGAYSEKLREMPYPTEWVSQPDFEQIPWEKHGEDRRYGRGRHEVLDAIRKDDPDALQALLRDGNMTVPFSFYELYVHVIPEDRKTPFEVKPQFPEQAWTTPQLCALFGAKKCAQLLRDKMVDADDDLVDAIVEGDMVEILQEVVEARPAALPRAAEAAIRCHKNDIFNWIVEKPDFDASKHLIETAIRYSNYTAFQWLVSRGKVNFARALCVCAATDSIGMMKFLLSHADAVHPYHPIGPGRATFLHFAAFHGGHAVLHWWVDTFGTIALDAVDGDGLNPYHYLVIKGLRQSHTKGDGAYPDFEWMRDMTLKLGEELASKFQNPQ